MNITAENFPLYQHLVALDAKATVHAQKDFAAACTGGDVELYNFAMGIQTVAFVPLGQIPGVTQEMNTKTLQSCHTLFRRVANGTSAQAATAKTMMNYFSSLGL
ncbi:MAG: hypothetical protein JWO78_486 [Micavibrio sp.]|nr:hypothetical protein [Micavibrio sp.]